MSAAETLLFEAVSRPARSLSPRGLRAVIAVLVVAASLPALLFLLLGAWPVLGFMGAEVALVLTLLLLHRRWAARAQEIIRLTEGRLLVTVQDGSGRRQCCEFEPSWVQLALEDAPDGDARLALVHRSRRMDIGRFISAQEKRQLAEALLLALKRYRQPIFDNPQLR